MVAETQERPCEIIAWAKFAVEPAIMTEEKRVYEHSLALHQNQQGPRFRVHFTRAEPITCKFNHFCKRSGSME